MTLTAAPGWCSTLSVDIEPAHVRVDIVILSAHRELVNVVWYYNAGFASVGISRLIKPVLGGRGWQISVARVVEAGAVVAASRTSQPAVLLCPIPLGVARVFILRSEAERVGAGDACRLAFGDHQAPASSI